MKIHLFFGVLLIVLVLAISVIVSLGKQVPQEFLIAFGGLSTYLIGLVTDNPFNNGGEK